MDCFRYFSLSLVVGATIYTSCGDDEVTSLVEDVNITFEARVGAENVSCERDYSFVGTSTTTYTAQLADARLFLSNFQLRSSSDGSWIPLSLVQNRWQYQGVALLDFENKAGACADSGTVETNSVVTATVASGTYDRIRFDVGIPFELNHGDFNNSPAPLNEPGMFWVWRLGHKFVRIDWLVSSGQIPRWNVHIGSTACNSATPQSPPSELCGRPNIATVEADFYGFSNQAFAVDLKALVNGVDLSLNTPDTPTGCQSSPAEPLDCAAVFTNLGLDFSTGGKIQPPALPMFTSYGL